MDDNSWLAGNTDSPFWAAVLIGTMTVEQAEDAERALRRSK